MNPPKRIRLLKACFDFKYAQVRDTLATDKDMRDLQGLKQRIEHSYELLSKPRKRTVVCINAACNFTDKFEPCEFGLTHYQAIGTCPACGGLMTYKNGVYTKVEINFSIKGEMPEVNQ